MKRYRLWTLVAMLGLMFCPVTSGAVDEPMAELKKYIDKGIAVLKDPQYQDADRAAAQRSDFWQSIKDVFDFTEVSRRALARNWRKFTPDQQKEFSAVFSELLGNTYVERIQKEFQNEQVVYVGQEIEKNNRALVKTEVARSDMKIPIDYRLHLAADRWRVYDVFVEGVSLVKNYRTQFNEFLSKNPPDALIERLKKKME